MPKGSFKITVLSIDVICGRLSSRYPTENFSQGSAVTQIRVGDEPLAPSAELSMTGPGQEKLLANRAMHQSISEDFSLPSKTRN